jgi:serine/threonine protein kinase
VAGSGNWHQRGRSQFAWEQEGLDHIKDRLPLSAPYQAWATFTVTAESGRVNEMDLLVITPGGVFLLELKAHSGELTNTGSTWFFRDPQLGNWPKTIENPLHRTDMKAKELKGRLAWAVRQLGLGIEIPYIDAAVFLTGERLVSHLDAQQSIRVFGRDDKQVETNLPRICTDFLDRVPRSDRDRRRVTEFSRHLPALMRKIGASQIQQTFTVGRFTLEGKPLDNGPTWMDFVGKDPAMPDDLRRIRIYFSRIQATQDERMRTARAAKREYEVLRGMTHSGIAQALDFVQVDMGSAVLFTHGKDDLRLDQYLNAHGDKLTLDDRLAMVRQLAEAVQYAHRRHLYHRTLAARSIYVAFRPDGTKPRLRITDWQAAARTADTVSATEVAQDSSGVATITNLSQVPIEQAAHVYLAPEFLRASEADPATMDVFGLGALTYLIVTGRPPAEDRKGLAATIAESGGLHLSAILDGVAQPLDDLVYQATRATQADRIPDVPAFLETLDKAEEAASAPDVPDEVDPLAVKAGQQIDRDWRVVKVLGTGATARALLVDRIDRDPSVSESNSVNRRVYKVALDSEKEHRLADEAHVLRDVHSANIVKWLDGPFSIGGRAVIAVEQAGDMSLAQSLRENGRSSIDELRLYGRNLFDALDHLTGKAVWHRDIKPDNLGVRKRRNGSKELVLFDFSLAHARKTDLQSGTPAYLDPFLGPPRRPEYDEHAERFSAAVTLHEIASAELPVWGDGAVEAGFTTDRLPSISTEAFDPVLRDGLLTFFSKALHRDTDERFATLDQMRAAWEQIFIDTGSARPSQGATAAQGGTDPDEDPSVRQAREQVAAAATLSTTLTEAGLSPRALEAVSRLGVQTVAEFLGISAQAIWRIRGIGRANRTELLNRSKQWRPLLATRSGTGASKAAAKAVTGITPWNLDAIVEDLVSAAGGRKGSKKHDAIRLMLGLPDTAGAFADLPVWPKQTEAAPLVGVTPAMVSTHVRNAADLWADSPKVADVLKTVLEILEHGGRIAEVGQLAPAVEDHYGSETDDPRHRRAYSVAVLRAAVETDQRAEPPQLLVTRHRSRVLLALDNSESEAEPTGREMADYAIALAKATDVMAQANPLPSPQTVVQKLRAVAPPDGAAGGSDAWLVQLAAATSESTAATARLELYPKDLALDRALRLSQAAISPLSEGLTTDELRAKILARLPELELGDVSLQQMRKALDQADSGLVYESGRFRRPVVSVSDSLTRSPSRPTSRGDSRRSTGSGAMSLVAAIEDRLTGSRARGGFLAVNVRLDDAVEAAGVLAAFDGVVAFDAGARFLAALKDVAAARGRSWDDVLEADRMSSERGMWHPGLRDLSILAWNEICGELVPTGGTVLLHDAGVLARYPGGTDVLKDLQDAARSGDVTVWLLCPVETPRERPMLWSGHHPVDVVTENEWIELSREAMRALR